LPDLGKNVPIYIITTESSLASLLEQFIEVCVGPRCPYAQVSFLVHRAEAERLPA
jgi:ABC-type antimicrobial peptide transport system ATPase subunit